MSIYPFSFGKAVNAARQAICDNSFAALI